MILGALTSRLAGPLASVAAVILLGLAVSQCAGRVKAERSLARAEKQIVAVKRDLGTCRANTAALEAGIRRQNEAVAGWKAEGDRRAALIEKARQQTRKEAERADRAAAALAKVKPAGNDVCARLLAVDEAVREIGQ